MANPLYPDVPTTPGVPAVLSYAKNAVTAEVAGLLADSLDGFLLDLEGSWGIYDSGGNQVVQADAVGSLEFGREFTIATAPQEQGAFTSYNKVAQPFSVRILLFCGGTDADRAAFFTALDVACASLSLYSVLTPEVSYASANVVSYRYIRRTDRGAFLVGAEVAIQEVRVTASAQFSNTAQPDGSPTQNDGSVQATPLNASDGAGIAAGGFY